MKTNDELYVEQSAWDWLCTMFASAAALFLAVSIPASYNALGLTHGPFLSGLLVIVLELLAFGSKVSQVFVPSWKRTLDFIALTLLGLTTVANFAEGWGHFWATPTTNPFWLGVREATVWGFHYGAFLTVLLSAALVPAGIYVFLSLTVLRFEENQRARTPEAVARRTVEPMLVQIMAVRELQSQLSVLTQQTTAPILLPTPVEDKQPSAPAFAEPGQAVGKTTVTVPLGEVMSIGAGSAKREAPMGVCVVCETPWTMPTKAAAGKAMRRRGDGQMICKSCEEKNA